MMNNKNSELLSTMDVKKLLVKLSIPATMGMIVNGLYNLMDTLFVSISEGELAPGALALAFPVQMIVMAIGLMIGIGAASVFSRAYGRGDRELMTSTVNTALRLDFIAALLVSVLATIYLDEMLSIFAASPSNIELAKSYLQIIIIGLLPLTLSMVLNNLTRAEGRAKVAMKSMILGTGLNIVLDPIFIFDWGFGLGVSGAAIATVISQIIAFIYIFNQSFAEDSVLRINLKKPFHLHLNTMRQVIVIGLPTFIRNSVGAFLAIIVFNILKFYVDGDHAIYVSIYGVINRIIFFVFMPAFGIVQGLTPIIGFNFGAQYYQRLVDVIKFATKIIVIYFVVGFVLIQLLSPAIFDVFSANDDPFFIEYGTEVFRIISYGFILVGFQIILGAIYQSFGYPLRALFISLSRQFIFFIPILFLFTQLFGLIGLWLTFIAADVISGLISIVLMKYEVREIRKKIKLS